MNAKLLDRLIPLTGASHADVIEYSTDIPMRYTECYAMLADGRKVRLKDCRQFVGWCGKGDTLDFLFDCDGQRVEICVDKADHHVHEVNRWQVTPANGAARDFVTRDGSMIGIELRERIEDAPQPRYTRNLENPVLDPFPEWRAMLNRA
ncbi:MAG: hypothetical protein QNJ00_08980 [Woeseiaceae bacterium]|nr:hypothetical protein [Woeseiaceae bacterium]